MEFNPKVNVIPTFKNSPGVKKVGIYARVSTARVEQLSAPVGESFHDCSRIARIER